MAARRTQTVRQLRLGAELRRLREHRGLTGDDVATTLAWSTAKISRIETAKSSAQLGDVRKLLALYEINGDRQGELLALASDALRRGWWMDYTDLPSNHAEFIAMEDEADSQLQWETSVIPGLLQSERYARTIIEYWNSIATVPPGAIERIVKVRLLRQRVLARQNPMALSVVLDESVLLRKYGDRSIMREQMDQILKFTEQDNVELRVLRLGGPHSLVAESFTLLAFSQVHDIAFPDIVHTEGLMANRFEDEQDTYQYRLAHQSFVADALGVEESRDLIVKVAREVW